LQSGLSLGADHASAKAHDWTGRRVKDPPAHPKRHRPPPRAPHARRHRKRRSAECDQLRLRFALVTTTGDAWAYSQRRAHCWRGLRAWDRRIRCASTRISICRL